ncbi:MAG: SWIM zinc finger family protein, partial [Actinomycetota bacterium]
MLPAWTSMVTESAIRRAVGSGAFQRGAGYWRGGHVVELEVDHDGDTITAEVLGSEPEPYETTVAAETGPGGRVEVFGECSCPMEVDCKHVAAVLLAVKERAPAARAAATAPVADWERSLADLRQPEEDAAAGFVPLGLLVEVV